MNPTQKELFEFNFPEKVTLENLNQISESLNRLNINIHNLGGYREKFNDQDARIHAQAFQEKLLSINTQAKELQNSAKTQSEKELVSEIVEISIHLYYDLQNFIDSNFFQKLKYDPVKTEGIETHDVKSKYEKYGIEGYSILSFIENGVSESLLVTYHREGLLQENFYPFILKNVPVEVLKSFLSHFNQQEKATIGYNLMNSTVAEILLRIANTPPKSGEHYAGINITFLTEYIKRGFRNGSSLNRELLGKYYPELLDSYEVPDPYNGEKKETRYLISLNEIQLAFDKMKGANNAEKLDRYGAYKSMRLQINEIFIANAIPALSPESIQRQVSESGGYFTVSDIYTIHAEGLNLKELRLFYESLPPGVNKDRSYEFLVIKKALPNTPITKILPYIRLIDGSEFGIDRSISYFLENKISPKSVQDYKKAGIRALYEIVNLIKSHVPLKYVQDLQRVGIQKLDIRTVINWHKAGLSTKQIKPFFDLRTSGQADYGILESENIKIYLEVIDSEEKHKQFLALTESGFSTKEALIAVRKKLTLEDMQMVKKYKFDVNWVEKFKKHDLLEFVQILEARNETNLRYSLEEVVTLLESGINRGDVKKMIQFHLDLSFAQSAHKAGENWREYLPYKKFARSSNLEALQMMKHFQVSPDNLKRYCSQYPNGEYSFDISKVDTVILSEYKRGNLPQEVRQFLEKYNLSFPSRYPVSILKQMQNGYESTERQGKPIALVVIGKNDWNSAFQSDGSLYEALLKSYNIYIYEVATENEFLSTVDKFGKQGTKIDFMIIGGHGNQEGINFSDFDREESDLDISDGDDLIKLKEYFSKEANISLFSCSTGKGGAGADNIASTISKALGGIKVLAPNIPTNIKAFRYDDNGRVIGVEYKDEGAEEEISIPTQK